MTKYLFLFISVSLISCKVEKPDSIVNQGNVERIIRTLSSDEMQGRAIFTPGIERAARFIESEFKDIGLQPLSGLSGFRQEFSKSSIKPSSVNVQINGSSVPSEQVIVASDQPALNWTNLSDAEVQYIKPGESFMTRYRTIMGLNIPVLVLVDDEFLDAFNRLRAHYSNTRVVDKPNEKMSAVFVRGAENPVNLQINISNKIDRLPLFNICGVIPGKSKSKEYVIFSGHYDHLGITETLDGDSIANGADDDASGVTAVISLARYYMKINNNERTIIFVAFTGEEAGMLGSKYFSQQLAADAVIAMFNIEMIGKESKFGKNAAFITGYDRSDFGQILQKNLAGTGFTFHPDPYKEQQLFYRSDNATLAALGVPAHTISTDQIDVDKFYHTVNDEFETLDVANIISTIKAIALSSRSIVAGIETPKRIPPLVQGK